MSTEIRNELCQKIIEAEAAGNFELATKYKKHLAELDTETMTTREVDYERGPHYKRVRVFVRGKLVHTELDD